MPKKPLNFGPRRVHDDDVDAPIVPDTKAGPGKIIQRRITDLEETILKRSGGVIEALEMPAYLDSEDTEYMERQMAEMTGVENLMHQGLRTPHLIHQIISKRNERITIPMVERYINAVYARWATLGGDVDVKRERGEAVAYLNLLKNQLWQDLTDAKTKLEKEEKKTKEEGRSLSAITSLRSNITSMTSQLHALNRQAIELNGLTPQAINQILVMGGTEDHEVLSRIKQTDESKSFLYKLAYKMRQFQLKDKTSGAVDAEEV